MNPLHIVLLIAAFLLAAGASFVASRPEPVARYALVLLSAGIAVWFLDLVLVAARVY
jgi:hypothetical protein